MKSLQNGQMTGGQPTRTNTNNKIQKSLALAIKLKYLTLLTIAVHRSRTPA